MAGTLCCKLRIACDDFFIICLKSSRAHCAAPPFRKSLVGLLRCLLLHAYPPLEKFRERIFLCDGGLDNVWQAHFAAIFVSLLTIFIKSKALDRWSSTFLMYYSLFTFHYSLIILTGIAARVTEKQSMPCNALLVFI